MISRKLVAISTAAALAVATMSAPAFAAEKEKGGSGALSSGSTSASSAINTGSASINKGSSQIEDGSSKISDLSSGKGLSSGKNDNNGTLNGEEEEGISPIILIGGALVALYFLTQGGFSAGGQGKAAPRRSSRGGAQGNAFSSGISDQR